MRRLHYRPRASEDAPVVRGKRHGLAGAEAHSAGQFDRALVNRHVRLIEPTLRLQSGLLVVFESLDRGQGICGRGAPADLRRRGEDLLRRGIQAGDCRAAVGEVVRDLIHEMTQLELLGVLVVFLLICLSPVLIRKRWATYIPITLFFLLQISYITSPPEHYGEIAALWIAITLNLLWLLAIRRSTEWALRNGSIWRHVLVVMSGVTVSVVCCFILPGRSHNGLLSSDWLNSDSPASPVVDIILFQSDARFFVAAISLVQLGVMTFGFLNWIIWPILSRAVYAAERYQFLRERKLFASVGIAILVNAATGGGWVKKIVDLLAKAVSW